MPNGILFLILPKSNAAKVTAFVRDLIVPDERSSIQILTDADVPGASRDMRSKVTARLIDRISAYPPHPENHLIIGREARCSISELIAWWRDRAFGNADIKKLPPAAVNRTVKDHLEESGRHWRTHAVAEIAKFDGPNCNLDAWLHQFGVLGYTEIGRKIAAKLRVIRTTDLPGRPLSLRIPDLIGHRQARCYVQDGDAGGSWLEMQGVLTHVCPPNTVFPVHWDTAAGRLLFPDVAVDEFVIYEDGLWSGSETVRRLHAIAAAPPPVPVILRFGVVTDFGLMVARQSIRSLDLLGRVSIDASSSEFIRFLGDVPQALALGLGKQPETYFKELHPHVVPYAFSISEDWTDDEIATCRAIGAQLVRHWLSQLPGKAPQPEKIERFALGGGQFASTVIFSRSVPKVSLPLLWLDGPVVLGDVQVNWRPLFVDARRVSESSLLYITAIGEVT